MDDRVGGLICHVEGRATILLLPLIQRGRRLLRLTALDADHGANHCSRFLALLYIYIDYMYHLVRS